MDLGTILWNVALWRIVLSIGDIEDVVEWGFVFWAEGNDASIECYAPCSWLHPTFVEVS